MKLKYNLLAKFSLLCALAFVMVQCNEDESSLKTGGDIEIRDSLPTGTYEYDVTNIQVTPGDKSLVVKWTKPEGAKTLSHYIVEWQGQNTDTTLYSSPANGTSYEITHLYNDSYKVKVFVVGENMLKSKGVEVAGVSTPTPDNQGPDNISNLEILPLATSATLSWNNPEDDDFYKIVIEVYNKATRDTILIDTLQSIDNMQSIIGLEELTEYEYHFQTFDYIGNASNKSDGVFKTLKEVKLDNKADWVLMAYSSQQPGSEAAFIIDGKDDTFWHSMWWPSQSPLPHWVVIDLNKMVKPSMVVVYRKLNDGRSSTMVKVEAKQNYEDTAEEWIDLGTSKIDPSTNEGQKCNLNRIVDARYLKVSVVATNTDKNAMIRELDVFVLAD